MSNKLAEHFSDTFKKHADALGAISKNLACNFEVPAQRIINQGFAAMGIDRFTRSGDDLWEMYTALKNDWEYRRPPKALRDRWASY
jgi:hypothetical protein